MNEYRDDEKGATTLGTLQATISELPTIPEILTRILQLIDDPNSSAKELAAVIRHDPPLASKVLRLANSPYYQKSRTLSSVQECIAVLGMRTVRQVAICVAVVSSLGKAFSERQSRLEYKDIWRHCVAVGATARWLARTTMHPDPELVFTGGLLHDLGKFVLALHAPDTYDRVIADRRRSGRTLVAQETATFGFDHADAGAAMGEAWLFPPELVACCGDHHRAAPDDRAVVLVALADVVANVHAPGKSDLGFDATLVHARELYAAAQLDPEAIDADLDALRTEIADAAAFVHVA